MAASMDSLRKIRVSLALFLLRRKISITDRDKISASRRQNKISRQRRIRQFMLRQRQQRIIFFMFLSLVTRFNMKSQRKLWSNYHSDRWWNHAYRYFDDVQFLENFRMTRSTFDYLCRILTPDLKKQVTNMRLPISVEHQIAISLWVLGTNAEYRTVAALFGVGRSTVCRIVNDFCTALHRKKDTFILFPKGDELDRVINGYREKWGFPNAGGAIDGSHIPILGPYMNHTDYHNRKGWYSVLIQAVVNDRYEFIDVNVGWPGSVHDARVYSNSGIFTKGELGILFEQKTVNVNGSNLPVVLLGDPAYPLSSFLMKPYSDNGRLTPQQSRFNYKLSSSRMTVENAFGRLKGRWRCLLKRLDVSIERVPCFVTACCILHNICEHSKDPFRLEWLEEVEAVNNQIPQPNITNHLQGPTIDDGNRIREIITEYFQL